MGKGTGMIYDTLSEVGQLELTGQQLYKQMLFI